jgi:hypothetical protein
MQDAKDRRDRIRIEEMGEPLDQAAHRNGIRESAID